MNGIFHTWYLKEKLNIFLNLIANISISQTSQSITWLQLKLSHNIGTWSVTAPGTTYLSPQASIPTLWLGSRKKFSTKTRWLVQALFSTSTMPCHRRGHKKEGITIAKTKTSRKSVHLSRSTLPETNEFHLKIGAPWKGDSGLGNHHL